MPPLDLTGFDDLVPKAAAVAAATPPPPPPPPAASAVSPLAGFDDLVPAQAAPVSPLAGFDDLVPPPAPPVAATPPAPPPRAPVRVGSFAPSGGVAPAGPPPLPVVQPWLANIGSYVGQFLTDAGTAANTIETPVPMPNPAEVAQLDWTSRPQARPSAITNQPVGATITAPTLESVPPPVRDAVTSLRDRNWTWTTPPEARPSAITNQPVGSTVTSPLDLQLHPREGTGIVMSPIPSGEANTGTQMASGVESVAQAPYAVGIQQMLRQRQTMAAIDAGTPIDPGDDPMGYQAMSAEQRAQARQQLDTALSGNLGTIAGSQAYTQALPVDPNYEAYMKGQIPFSQAPLSITQAAVVPQIPALLSLGATTVLGGPIAGVAAGSVQQGASSFADQLFATMRADGVDPNDQAARLAWVQANGQRLVDAYGTEMANSVAQNILMVGPFEAARYLPVPRGARIITGVGLGGAAGGEVGPDVQTAITGREVSPQERTVGEITGALFGGAGGGHIGAEPVRIPRPEFRFRPDAEVPPREPVPPPPAEAPPPPPAPPPEPPPVETVPPARVEPVRAEPPAAPPAEPPGPVIHVPPGEVRPGEIPPGEVRPGEIPPGEVRPGETPTPTPAPGETPPVTPAPGETPPPVSQPAVREPTRQETPVLSSEPAPAPVSQPPPETVPVPTAAPHPESIAGRIDALERLGGNRTEEQTTELHDLYQQRTEHEQPSAATTAKATELSQVEAQIGTLERQIAQADRRKNAQITPTKAQVARREEVNQLYQQRRELQDQLDTLRQADAQRARQAIHEPPAPETRPAETRAEPAPAPVVAEERPAPAARSEDVKSGAVVADIGEPSFATEAFTERQSRARRAFQEAGHDPALAENYPPARKLEILSKHIAKKFGFKEVTGDVRDRQRAIDQLLDFNDNAHVFASAHGIPLEHIGQGATLALRPRDKRTPLGSWHPGTRTLSLFGRSNSFAHEWWHMMDQKLVEHLGRGHPIQDLASRHTLEHGFGESADLTTGTTRAFANLLNEIYTGQPHLSDEVFRLLQEGSHRPTGPGVQRIPASVAKARSDLYALMSQHRSDYIQHSEAFARMHGGDPYWIYPHELVARAGEAFSAHEMQQLGLDLDHSPVISKHDRAYLSGADERFRDTFPKEEERTRIHAAMRDLLDNMRRDQIIGDGRPGSAREVTLPGSFDQLDPARWITRQVPANERGVGAAVKKVAQGVADDARGVGRLITDTSGVLHEGQRRLGIEPDRGSLARQAYQGTKRILQAGAYSMGGRMGVITNRYTGGARQLLQNLRDKFDPQVGTGRFIKGAYGQTVNYEFRARMNKISEILNRKGLADMMSVTRDTAEVQRQKDILRDAMTGHPQANTPRNIIEAAAAIRSELTDLWYYSQRAGIDMGVDPSKAVKFANEPYFPRMLVHRLVAENGEKFLQQARLTYGDQFDERIAPFTDKAERLGAIRRVMDEIRDPSTGKPIPWHDEASAREAYAERKAEAWHTRLGAGNVDSFDTLGPDAGFRNERVLPASADVHMRDFYVRDPVDALQQHVRQAVSHAEYVRRMGDQKNMQALRDRAFKLGVSSKDINEMFHLIELTTGRNRTMVTDPLRHGMDLAYTYGTMGLMPRAVFASLAEPVMAAVRSGDLGTTVKAFQSLLTHITKGPNAIRHEEIAQAFGVVTHSAFEQIMADRMTSGMHEGAENQHMLTNFYARTGLTGLTNYQRAAMVGPAEHFIRKMLTESQGTGRRADIAQRQLRELGMNDPTHARLNDWMQEPEQRDGLRADRMLNDEGQLVGQGIARFIDSVIQDPTRIDKPEYAFNPYGRFITGLMSFNMALTRNLHGRMFNEFRSAPTYAEGAARMAPYLWTIPALIGGNMAASLVRDQLFGVVNPNDNPDDAAQRAILRGISRSGVTGNIDPLIQAWQGLRYQRSITALFGGAQLGFFTGALENMIRPWTAPNSPNTNTAERAMVKGFHAAVTPALMAAMTAFPGGWLSAGLGMWGTSAQGANVAANLTYGPAETKSTGGGPVRPDRPARPARPGR